MKQTRKLAANALDDVERLTSLVMQEAQMSLAQAGRIVGKLIAVSMLGFMLASNDFFSWYLVPIGVIILAMSAGWVDTIGKECKRQCFFPYKVLNTVGASIFKWQWVALWFSVVFLLSSIGSEHLLGLMHLSASPAISVHLNMPERLLKVCMMALVPLTLMLLGRSFKCGSASQFQRARCDIQKAQVIVQQLTSPTSSPTGSPRNSTPSASTPTSPLFIDPEKIPLYQLGSVAKVLNDIVASHDTTGKGLVKLVDFAHGQASMPNGFLQQLISSIFAPFRAASSSLFLWETRDLVLYVITALYLALMYGTSVCGHCYFLFSLPLCVLVPFMLCQSKVSRNVWALQEKIRVAQEPAKPLKMAPAQELPTLAEIRAAVPAHCFERSAARSLLLVLRDGLMLAALFALATYSLRVPGMGESLTVLDWLGWAFYAFWQGVVGTGWWVLAHECGHGGFSPSDSINNAVGFVLHSILLVPYFSWQYSHSKHHKNCNHLMDGESHVPDTLEELEDVGVVQLYKFIGNDVYGAIQVIGHLVFGWWLYLFFNVTGGRRLQGKLITKPASLVSHFTPGSPLFPVQWWTRVALSMVGLSVTLAGLTWAACTYGLGAVTVYYLLPYCVTNAWLVAYTWLQHTDPELPHYGDSDWTWVKGALSTIDRPYGIFDFFHHHIGSTHVCHHVFSKLPCYHAVEATQHLKAFLEPLGLYNYDPTFVPLAAWRVATTCHYIEGTQGTQYYKSFSQLDSVRKQEANHQLTKDPLAKEDRVSQEASATSKVVPPQELPSLAEIRAAVPAHCFERSAAHSLLLVLRDGLMLAGLFALAIYSLRVPGMGESLTVLDWAGWAFYAFWQGVVGTGWWVLAHECGHGGFSPSDSLNNAVGFVLHSILLVPYFSWQYSHSKHHKNCNHLMDGESHVPDTLEELEDVGVVQLYKFIGNDVYGAIQMIGHLVFGWWLYLFFNVTGGRRLQGKLITKPASLVSHFTPGSPLFPAQWWTRVALSMVGLSVTLAGLTWAAYTYGLGAVAVCYFFPYCVTNAWLVGYTWLQHTDPELPHYGDSDWTWVKGALSTIDRPYGIFDFFHHHIGSTHVCHHVFSKLPCYHAVEATQHLKAFLEPLGLYNYDPTFVPLAAWKVATTCHYIEGTEGTQYYKSFEQLAKKQSPTHQSVNRGLLAELAKEEQVLDPKMWYIHGNAYDLTPYMDKHPGGRFAIESAQGRECTALFESYHPWNDNNRKVIARYGPKPPPCDPFYEEMKVGVRAMYPGGAKDTRVPVSTQCCLWVAWSLLMYCFFVVKTPAACAFAGILVGLFVTRLAHEGGHMLMSKREWVNRLTLFLGYFPAGPSLCWYYRHVISHHPHTNTHDDVDVRYIHLVDMLPNCLRYLKVVSLPGIFIGAVAELSVVQSLEMILMRCVESNPVYLWTNLGGWAGVGSIIPEAIIWAAFHGWFGPSLWCYMCMWLTAGAVFVPMSQLAHVIMYPDPNLGSKSWATDQIIACVNFAPRSFYTPFSGMNKLRHSFWYHMAFGLTTQIDHHLFPSIAARCYDDIHEQVIKPVCAKYNVPLYEVSAQTALSALWQRLLTGQASTALLDGKKSD